MVTNKDPHPNPNRSKLTYRHTHTHTHTQPSHCRVGSRGTVDPCVCVHVRAGVKDAIEMCV